MRYINTHGKILPKDALEYIGIEGARGDDKNVTFASLQAFRNHYGPDAVWCLPHYYHTDRQAVGIALLCKRAGITKIECANEPEGTWWNVPPLTPEQCAARFAAIKTAVGPLVQVYGPSTSVWNPHYIDAFMKALPAGMKPDRITWHGYNTPIDQMDKPHLECLKLWGVQGFDTEVAFEPLVSWTDYPVTVGQVEGYKQAKESLGMLDWCLYDGPESADGRRVGLFAWNGAGWLPTETYNQIAGIGGVRSSKNPASISSSSSASKDGQKKPTTKSESSRR